jgi:type I restriction enzyme S subunit
VDYGVTAASNPQPVGPKFLRITDIQDGAVNWDAVPWCECDSRSAKDSRLQSGDIVFARTGATTGKSFLIRDCPSDAVFASYLIRVRVRDEADPRYVSHFFQTRDYWAQITKGARGVAQPGVNATTLKAIQVPLPSLAEQVRIAELMDRAEALRVNRQTTIDALDTLPQALFLDLFGDPATNPKGWPDSTIGESADQVTDGEHITPTRTSHGIKLLSARNVRDGYIDFANVDYVSPEEHDRIKVRCNPSMGDVLISCSGTIGRVASVETNEPFSLVRSVALVRPRRAILKSKFMENYLRTPALKSRMLRRANASSQANLFQGQIRELPIFIPPLALQDEFVRRVTGVDKLKFTYRASLSGMGTFFAALQYRAFRGEL